jgi:hypothetical protein
MTLFMYLTLFLTGTVQYNRYMYFITYVFR